MGPKTVTRLHRWSPLPPSPPGQAIDMFNNMLARTPVEHFMMMLPPGLEPAKFASYAEVFAKEVLPEFSSSSTSRV
jgi:hypothetical protein